MYIDRKSWLNATKVVAQKFIEINYSPEVSLFDSFWQAFSFKVNKALKVDASGQLTLDSTGQVIANISFARDSAIDSVSPVVLPTVAVIMQQIQKKNFSQSKLEELISSTAAHFGAKPSLTACLVRSLPALCNEVMSYEPNASEATVSVASEPQYKIWTNGKSKIADSIDKYEKNKDKYLFWIDLDQKRAKSNLFPDPRAIELLKYIVKNIGHPNPIENILRNVYKEAPSAVPESDYNKIEQHLTQLNKYTKRQFRKYLFRNWPKVGLGLENSFRDKYFLFTRLTPLDEQEETDNT